jgi:hypothetical protein
MLSTLGTTVPLDRGLDRGNMVPVQYSRSTTHGSIVRHMVHDIRFLILMQLRVQVLSHLLTSYEVSITTLSGYFKR